MIYVAVFIISLVCIRIACVFRGKSRGLFLTFSFIGILVPCLLAAFRDLSIGTDVGVYVKPLFDSASWYNDFSTYFLHPNSAINDVLYLLLTFICRHTTESITLLFFSIEALIMVPLYIALLRSNRTNKNSVALGMFIFFMFFYNATFNMARQSISLSFVILAMTYLDDNKNIKFIILSLIACLFHSSAAIIFLVFFVYKYEAKLKNKSFKKTVTEFLMIILLLLAFAFLPSIVSLFISLGIDSLKFSSILSTFLRDIDINWVNTLFYIYIWAMVRSNQQTLKEKVKNYNFYSFMSLACILILQFGSIIKYSDRIGFYIFYPLLFIVLPKLAPENFKSIKKTEFRNMFFLLAGFIAYWVFWIVISNYHETFPYVFYGG